MSTIRVMLAAPFTVSAFILARIAIWISGADDFYVSRDLRRGNKLLE